MNRTGSRLAMGGAGLAAACAVVCCSAPLLVLLVPGLALLIGGLVEGIEAGLVVAIVLGALTAIGVLVWRRHHESCSKRRPALGLFGSACSDPQGCVTCSGRGRSSTGHETLREIPIVADIGAGRAASVKVRDDRRFWS